MADVSIGHGTVSDMVGPRGPAGPSGPPGSPGIEATEVVVGAGAIPAGALIKATSTAGRYALWLKTDNPLLIVGCAVTACSGAAASFSAQFISGLVSTLLSDGAGTIASGAAVVASAAMDGRVKSGAVTDAGFLGFNVGAAVAATVDAHVSVR